MPRHMRKIFVISSFLVTCLPALVFAQSKFTIDSSQSEVSVNISATFAKLTAKTSKLSGSIEVPGFPGDLVSGTKADFIVNAKSLTIPKKGPNKDMHEDVLESEKYPEIKLSVKKITPAKAAYSYNITADLTIRGVTKSVSFRCAVISYQDAGKDALSVSGKVTIDMTKWGIKPPSIIVNKVKDELDVKWTLVAVKK